MARQESGTAGRVEHGQSGVWLAYARARGQAWLDRALYLPQEWRQDRERCTQAGMPQDRALATQPELARRLRERAFQVGVPAPWVTGDSVYGEERRRRRG